MISLRLKTHQLIIHTKEFRNNISIMIKRPILRGKLGLNKQFF